MKKQFLYRRWTAWACLLLFAGFVRPHLLPPDDPTKHPIPHMHLARTASMQEEQNFRRFSRILSTHIGNRPETESFYFDTAAFMGMGRALGQMPNAVYLEIFLAVYGPAGSSNVPAGWDNKLTLLYAPTDAGGQQLGYYVLPDSAKGFDPATNKVPDADALGWITNYQNTVVQWLNPYLDPADTYNYVDNNTNTAITNTIKIKYYLSDFDELRKEMDYQASAHKDTITGFKAFIAALPEQPVSADGSLSNRLKVEFEFTQKDYRIFYIDTTAGFSRRRKQPPHFPLNKRGLPVPVWYHARGLDNGQMCPPTCNP